MFVIPHKEAIFQIARQGRNLGFVTLFLPLGLVCISTDVATNFWSYWFPTLLLFIGSIAFRLTCNEVTLENSLDKFWSILIWRTLLTIVLGIMIHHYVDLTTEITLSTLLALTVFVGAIDTAASTFYPSGWLMRLQMFILGASVLTVEGFFYGDNPHYGMGFVAALYVVSRFRVAKDLYQVFLESIEAHQKLSNEKKLLEDFMDLVPANVTWLDHNFFYKAVNQGFAQSFKKSKKDFVGREFGSWKVDNETWEIRKALDELLKSEKTEKFLELNMTLGQEKRRHQFFLKKKTAENGHSDLFILSLDVEDHKKTEQALEDERAKNIHSSRLASLGEVSAGIAHEIKNPLTVILGSAQMMERDIQSPTPDKERLINRTRKILETVHRITKIIDSMRRLSRDNSDEGLEWVALKNVIDDPLTIVLEKLKAKEVRFENSFVKTEAQLYCRPQQISQVLLNMINNAAEALEERHSEDRMISLKSYQDQFEFQIIIEDNGPGVSHPEKLFMPFFTTKEPGKGTGLGLSISQKIMHQNLGALKYQRLEGRTQFILSFPLSSYLLTDSLKQ